MSVFRQTIEFSTKTNHYVDITRKVVEIVRKSKIKQGLCNIFIPGTTAGIMSNENERMLMEDFRRFFETIEEDKPYNHPDNAYSHLRANLLDTEKTIPVINSDLMLGTWQSILVWEFDNTSRKRKVIVTVIGDKEEE